MISQVSSVSFLVYTLFCVELWSTESWQCDPKAGAKLGYIRDLGVHFQRLQNITVSVIQMAICQKRLTFRIAYFSPLQMPPLLNAARSECPPSLPPAATGYFPANEMTSDGTNYTA